MSAARPYAATRLRKLVSRDPEAGPIGRLVRAFGIIMPAVLVIAAAYLVGGAARDFVGTIRTTPRFDPPVLAGQNVPGPCSSGGFYARDQKTIVLTMAAHCADAVPGGPLRDWDGVASRHLRAAGATLRLPHRPVVRAGGHDHARTYAGSHSVGSFEPGRHGRRRLPTDHSGNASVDVR